MLQFLSRLCLPAKVYLVLAVIGFVLTMIQNFGNQNMYCLGSFRCRVPSTILVFLGKIIVILFWTYLLSLICRDNMVGLAWFLVLLPILMVLVLGVGMHNQDYSLEGMVNKAKKAVKPKHGMMK